MEILSDPLVLRHPGLGFISKFSALQEHSHSVPVPEWDSDGPPVNMDVRTCTVAAAAFEMKRRKPKLEFVDALQQVAKNELYLESSPPAPQFVACVLPWNSHTFVC